jgi:hypothetical protein
MDRIIRAWFLYIEGCHKDFFVLVLNIASWLFDFNFMKEKKDETTQRRHTN